MSQPTRAALRRKADRLFSLYIRARDKCCQRCGATDGLQCAHTFSRRYLNTRWDKRAARALCLSCHKWETENPIQGRAFWRELLGARTYNLLERLAQQPWDRDYDRIFAWLKEAA